MKDTDWEILYELHKNPNMTKVANLLYITQPSLTKRIQHMEEEFQITIVNRTPKGLEFTPEGEYLAEQAGKYKTFLESTRSHLQEMKDNSDSEIVIGSSYTFSKYTLSDLLLDYRKNHPGVNFTIINEQSDILFKKMLDESVDVAFVRDNYEGAVNKTLVAVNKAYLITKEPTELEKLPQMQYISYKTNKRSRDTLSEWWHENFNSDMPAGMTVGYVDVAWQVVAKGLGYTLGYLPDNFVNEYNLCLTPLIRKDGSFITRNTWFLYPKSKRTSRTLEEFAAYIEKNCKL